MVAKELFKLLFVIINTILYLVVIATWIAMPEELTFNLSLSVFNICLTLILLYFSRKNLQKYYLSGQFQKFSVAVLRMILIFCILGFLNFLSFKNPTQFDVTERGLNSLTEQSKKILENIEGPLKFEVFCRKNEFRSYKELFELYRMVKANITIVHIDVDLRPDLVGQNQIEKSGTVILHYKKRREYLLDDLNELNITNTIIRATRKENPLILFTKGHQELNFFSSEKQGGSHFLSLLKKSSYDVREIDLRLSSKIPKEAKALVVWGPKNGFFKEEIIVLKNYLDKGGHLLIALDPNWNEDRVANLREFLIGIGLMLKNNIVLDRIRFVKGSNGMIPLIDKFDKSHPITRNFNGQVFFPLSSSVVVGNGISATGLAFTGPYPASWADNNPRDILSGKISFDDGVDVKGPISVAQAYESEDGKTKIVAFGNSSFIHNSYKKFAKNFIFLLNSLSWLVDEERLISFNLPVVKDEPIFVAANQMALIFYFSVIFLPLILFIISFVIYRRRARL